MSTRKPHVGLLHYSAPPIIGGVEAVLSAHAALLSANGYPVTVVAGRGEEHALPEGTRFGLVAPVDSQHQAITAASALLEQGIVPADFEQLVEQLTSSLAPILAALDVVIVHNVFTKHFNLPLTAALFQLLDARVIRHCIAWGHDFTWTSPNSRSLVFAGHPWDLLRTYHEDVTYVVVSEERRRELVDLYQCPPQAIRVIYNGVDPAALWGLSPISRALVERLALLSADLILLMPVRVTQAKNVEYALEVVAELERVGLAVKLVYTGPPDPHDAQSMAYYHRLQARRSELGLDDSFHFVFESGPDPDSPFLINMTTVSDLYRVSDLLFMPSHREGFGMPILEAGLLGLPIIASDAVPAAREIGGVDVLRFEPDTTPAALARLISRRAVDDPRLRLARQIRHRYTWEAIFRHDIEPLLEEVSTR